VLDRVTIRFGGLTAVSELDLAVSERALVGLIGPNGAGKTTVFNLITGVYQPTEGPSLRRKVERPESGPIRSPNTASPARSKTSASSRPVRLRQRPGRVSPPRAAAASSTPSGGVGLSTTRTRRITAQVLELLAIFKLERFRDTPAKSLPTVTSADWRSSAPWPRDPVAPARRAGRRNEPHRKGGADEAHPVHPGKIPPLRSCSSNTTCKWSWASASGSWCSITA
jgi:hypothetical protein